MHVHCYIHVSACMCSFAKRTINNTTINIVCHVQVWPQRNFKHNHESIKELTQATESVVSQYICTITAASVGANDIVAVLFTFIGHSLAFVNI